jgi:4-diphosphocytidyl-2-C-methyl-D-erythritol kinase
MPTNIPSFSKINLGLAIGPLRSNGFHALSTIYQTLALHDIITISCQRSAKTSIKITSNHPKVPLDNANTAWKMAEQTLKYMRISAEINLHIEKNLPVQGGLGAGSANAIATLIGLEHELGQSLTEKEKLDIAREIGSDVPLFLVGGTVLGLNRGEDVYSLPDLPQMYCLMAISSVAISTSQAFRDWDNISGKTSRINANKILTTPNKSDQLKLLNHILAPTHAPTENPLLTLVHTGIENDFESIIFSLYPSLRQLKDLLVGSESTSGQAMYTALSGSGSTVFGLYPTEQEAQVAKQRISEFTTTELPLTKILLTKTLDRETYWQQMIKFRT